MIAFIRYRPIRQGRSQCESLNRENNEALPFDHISGNTHGNVMVCKIAEPTLPF